MSEPYGGFAGIYDRCMRYVPYDRWAEYVGEILERFGHSPARVVDLGCGTGSTTLPWGRLGLEVIGVDKSPAMLEQARARARSEDLDILFLEQDIVQLNLPHPVDLALCLYDTVNYVLEPADLSRLFGAVAQNLTPGGMFIFDINSHHKLSSISPETFHMEGEGYNLIWEQRYSETDRIWTVNLTGFVECDDGRFRRFREQHRERAYRRQEIEDLLAPSTLALLACYRAYGFEPAGSGDDRFYFVTCKEEKTCC